MTKGPTVVALSGGVDSAAAAALLVRRGEPVIGITMRLFDAKGTSVASGGRCCGPRDIADARRVCEHLGIPFYVVDFSTDFGLRVVDDFVAEYAAGRTPNPCVRCNQHIKFTPLLRRARALGAESLVTGHYARRVTNDSGAVELHRGKDGDKDQSYFLFSMPADQLEAVRFPLGDLTKNEVRDIARDAGLPNSEKRESQEICFVPDGDYADFVERRSRDSGILLGIRGDIVDAEGRVLGRHRGIHRYTVGQRRGLGISTPDGEPIYVVRIDADKNQVVVGAKGDAAVGRLAIKDLRWLSAQTNSGEMTTAVQVRYRSQPMPCRLRWSGDRASIELADPATASPGQAAVLYDDDRVLGGGWID